MTLRLRIVLTALSLSVAGSAHAGSRAAPVDAGPCDAVGSEGCESALPWGLSDLRDYVWGLGARVAALELNDPNFDKLIAESDSFYKALVATQTTVAEVLGDLASLDARTRTTDDRLDQQEAERARRDIAFVTGVDGGRPTYQVHAVYEAGWAPGDALFTVDLSGMASDVRDLIEGTVKTPCATVYKGAEPYRVGDKPALLCLAPVGGAGTTTTSTVGVTYVSAADAYEMYTGSKLVFSPYQAVLPK